MIGRVTNLETGWVSVSLAVRPDEVDKLIDTLRLLKDGEVSHFHLRCDDFEPETGLADVEVSLMGSTEVSNMSID